MPEGQWVNCPLAGALVMTDELERYRCAVREAARDLLLDATWAPEAIHEAQQRDQPIALPSYALRREDLAPHPLKLDPGVPMSPWLFARMARWVDQMRDTEPRDSLRGNRDRTWHGAVESVAAHLRGEPLSSTSRSHRKSARRYLDAAVSGAVADVRLRSWNTSTS